MILVRLGMRPADTLGISDPVRPFVTGGLGLGVYLVLIHDWENGELHLVWYFTDGEGGWDISTPIKTWKMTEADKVYAMGDLELERYAREAGFVWATSDLNLTRTFTEYAPKWVFDLTAKWETGDVDNKWTVGDADVKWNLGKVY